MTTPRLAVFAPLALLCTLAAAQQQVPAIRETVDVTVANVDVVVTDRAGNRVRGLTSEDFELIEDGVPQRIANFAEFDENAIRLGIAMEAEAPNLSRKAVPLEALSRRVVIYWDVSMDSPKTILQRRRIESAIATILDDLDPQDEVMFVSWNGTLNVEVAPTRDVAAVRDGIRRMVGAAPLGRVASKGGDPCDPTFQKRAFSVLVEENQRASAALRTVLSRLMPLRGRKVLVLISQGFVAQPALEVLLCGVPRGGGELNDPLLGEQGGRHMSAVMSRSLDRFAAGDLEELQKSQDLMADLISTANAAGVTLYTIHGAGLVAPELAAGAGISDEPLQQNYASIGNSVAGLRRIAEETGGLVAGNTNDFEGPFRAIAADLGSYYSIGYRVSDAKREGDRRIEIRMRNPELTARSRRSVSIRSPEAEVSDAVLASLEFGDAANDLAISALPLPVTKTKRGRFAIPLELRIPLEPLSFIQERDSFAANVSIFIAAADPKKTSTEVERLDHRIEISATDFETIAGTYYTYRLSIDLRGRSAENRIAIGVLDQLSKMSGFTAVTVGAHAPPN
ncbi:MAG TPA: VWA domain-containing protein [Thermoanaerobaculia bacterium]|nr:VWA domain-containing protein [Thermoanaerobaculia bacterium]